MNINLDFSILHLPSASQEMLKKRLNRLIDKKLS